MGLGSPDRRIDLLATGLAVLSGQLWAIVLGVFLAMASAFTQLLFITVFPLWSLAIIAIGGSLEAAILASMHLKAANVGEVWAEASEVDREEVLKRVGVDRTFSPERDMARRLAQRIARQDVADFIPIAEGYGVVEMPAPGWMRGKTLLQLELRNEMRVAILSIKSAGGKVTMVPQAGREIKEGDTLMLVGSDEDLLKVRERT